MWFTATGLSHAFWMCLASPVSTEVPERLVQIFSTETTDWSDDNALYKSGRPIYKISYDLSKIIVSLS